jgi:hypothetical protein
MAYKQLKVNSQDLFYSHTQLLPGAFTTKRQPKQIIETTAEPLKKQTGDREPLPKPTPDPLPQPEPSPHPHPIPDPMPTPEPRPPDPIALQPTQEGATGRILEHKKATLEAEIERLRREYRIALIDYERAQLGRRDAA